MTTRKATNSSSSKPTARLLLRVHSAKKLPHSAFSQGVYCKLYLGDTPMTNGSQKSLFAKKSSSSSLQDENDDHHENHVGETSVVEPHATHRIFRTKTVPHTDADTPAVWDENFDVVVVDAAQEILSVRVKSKHRLYPSVLGVCAIQLKKLKEGRSVDQWFPLMKGSHEVASLRLQLILSPPKDRHGANNANRKHDLQADIKTALAANHAADDAIERLLASATNKKPTTNNDNNEIDLPMVRAPNANTNTSAVYSA